MLTPTPKPHFEKLKAKTLSEVVRESDVNAAEALAFLAYTVHGDTTPLIDAREAGAAIGSVGPGAHMLKNRIENQLT